MSDMIIRFDPIIDDVVEEYNRATHKFGPFNTQHEAYAVMLEEMDELWAEIKRKSGKRTKRNKNAIRKEATQVAAMAIRLIMDMEEEACV